VTALADPGLCSTLCLHRVLVTAAAARSPVQGYLFRPMDSSQRGFKQAPFRSSAVNSSYRKRMHTRCAEWAHTAQQQAGCAAGRGRGWQANARPADRCMHENTCGCGTLFGARTATSVWRWPGACHKSMHVPVCGRQASPRMSHPLSTRLACWAHKQQPSSLHNTTQHNPAAFAARVPSQHGRSRTSAV